MIFKMHDFKFFSITAVIHDCDRGHVIVSQSLVPLSQSRGPLQTCFTALKLLYSCNFFPPNAFLRRRRKKALLRVNDRGGGWKMCILALCRVCVRAPGHVCS